MPKKKRCVCARAIRSLRGREKEEKSGFRAKYDRERNSARSMGNFFFLRDLCLPSTRRRAQRSIREWATWALVKGRIDVKFGVERRWARLRS